MSTDAIALCRENPDIEASLSSLLAAGGDLGISHVERGGLVRLHGTDGRVLLNIEGPRLVQIPSEATRLLDPQLCITEPIWWIEVRAADNDADAAAVARSVVDSLISITGGHTWFSP